MYNSRKYTETVCTCNEFVMNRITKHVYRDQKLIRNTCVTSYGEKAEKEKRRNKLAGELMKWRHHGKNDTQLLP